MKSLDDASKMFKVFIAAGAAGASKATWGIYSKFTRTTTTPPSTMAFYLDRIGFPGLAWFEVSSSHSH